MWVYQQTAADQEFTGHPCPEVSMAPALGSAEPLRPELPDEGSPSQTRSSIQKSASRQISGQKNCWLLVCAFLLGSMAAGVIEAMCAAQPLDWTAHYFQAWSKLFAAADPQATIDLFGIQYLTLVFAATVLLLLGFSALGPVLIFLFAMFCGLGSGMLTIQLFELQRNAGRLLVALLPAAVAADGLCIFGADALRVSGQIRACSFFTPDFCAGHERIRLNTLMRAYLLTIVLFLPLCGVSTALAAISSRL